MTPPANVSRRAVLGGALGLAAAGVLGACGSNKGTGAAATGGGGSKVSLSQWYHQYGEKGTQEAAKKYAAEYTDATVQIQWIPGDYPAKLSSGLSSGNGPDAFEGHLERSLVSSGQVVPLDDLIADVKDDYAEGDLAANSIDGKLYSIPMINDPQMLYYRKSLFEAKGIKPPQTLDDLIAAAKELTDKSVKGLFAGNDANNTGGGLTTAAIYSTGGRFLTADHKIGFDPAKVAEVLLKLRKFAADKSLLLGAPTDWWDPSAINQNLCAMQWIGMWAVPGMSTALGADEIGAFPFPAAAGGKPAVVSGGWSAFVSAKSKNIDAAKAFTKWLWVDKTDLQEDWSLSYGFHIPPRKSLAAKASKLQSGPAAESVKLNTDYGVQGDPNWTPAMSTALTDAVTRVIGKGGDPETELAGAVKKINTELSKIFG
ncbi:sugar ABC transporter substrate-binding protein [Kribbella sp. NPDC050459]|jgi:multiple sugar transport system substrate-binding protein|uniref:ABC transporter substrate-binding protein n=1 Tax=Kribbella sp. NPDC050459 TaxID=3155785 RepID=UPI002FB49DD4